MAKVHTGIPNGAEPAYDRERRFGIALFFSVRPAPMRQGVLAGRVNAGRGTGTCCDRRLPRELARCSSHQEWTPERRVDRSNDFGRAANVQHD
jgi:hypothetical protein